MRLRFAPKPDLLENKYHLRVQLSMGESAKLIGPVHRIYLIVGKKEKRFHLGDEDFEILIVKIAWENLGADFDPSDMQELKKRLKKQSLLNLQRRSPKSSSRRISGIKPLFS